jgi:hypothetical protein
MDPRLLRLLAIERQRELLGTADARRPRPPRPLPVLRHAAVTIRYAFPDDASALTRLAALDSSEPPTAPVLVAEVEGELRAAISLSDGFVVADPFHPSTGLLELLAARAVQLTDASGSRRRPRPAARALSLVLRRSF